MDESMNDELKEIDRAYVNNTPRVIHEGCYRLYEKPDGSMRVQYKRSDRNEEDFLEIPAAFTRLARMGANGDLSMMDIMKEMMTMMRTMR